MRRKPRMIRFSEPEWDRLTRAASSEHTSVSQAVRATCLKWADSILVETNPALPKTTKEKKSMKSRTTILAVLFLALFGAIAAHASTSVSADGVVHSVFVSAGVNHLKIERPDGSKVSAACNTDAFTEYNCAVATPGETAWGRAVCNGGICAWSCLDVTDQCSSGPQYFQFTGTVLSKSSCAGYLYLTMLYQGSELTAQCLNYSQCQAANIGATVSGFLRLQCGAGDWVSITPQ